MFLKISQNSQASTCARVSFFNKVADLRLETLAQVFSREFCETFKKPYFYRTPLVVACHFKILRGINTLEIAITRIL